MRAIRAAIVVALVWFISAPADASIMIGIQDITIAPDATGYFDVYVQTTGEPLQISSWNMVLRLAPKTGTIGSVTFADCYVLATDEGPSPRSQVAPSNPNDPLTDGSYNPMAPIYLSAVSESDPQTILGASSQDCDFYGVSLVNGTGLFRVKFQTSADASGIWDVLIDPDLSSLAGTAAPDFAPLTTADGVSFSNGTINVPEPATMIMLAVSGAMLIVRRREKHV